jgi:hypothetical protein
MSSDGPLHVKFEPTVTLGNIVQIVVLVVLLVGAWTKINDEVQENTKAIADDHAEVMRQRDVLVQMQLNEERMTTILDQKLDKQREDH